MIEGERVFVEADEFNGMATIMYIAPGEIWPIQIELDNPDEDGHKIKRVAPYHIRKNAIEEPKRFYARVAKMRNGYRVGDEYIVSSPGPNGYYHVYLPDRPGTPVGSYISNFFEIIRQHQEPKKTEPRTEPQKAQIEPEPVEVPIPLKTKNKSKNEPKRPQFEQLTIFDILEA